MRTKNASPITAREHDHIGRVKQLPCSVCDAPGPSDAHHITQGQHWTVIPCCVDCHTGSHNGIHGRKAMWNVTKKTELSCLNDTIRRLYGMV